MIKTPCKKQYHKHYREKMRQQKEERSKEQPGIKYCTALSCGEAHTTKWKMCPTCLEVNRERMRLVRKSTTHKIKQICLNHPLEEGCKQILELMNEKYGD